VELRVTRLWIRRIRLTHSHLLSGDPPPVCIHCDVRLAVLHFLHQCPLYDDSLGDDRNNVSNVVAFLRGIGVDSFIVFISFYLKFGSLCFDSFIILIGLHASCFIKASDVILIFVLIESQ
jgi:hypothetical protein